MFTRVTDLIVLVGVLFSSTLSSAGETVLRRPLETLRTTVFFLIIGEKLVTAGGNL